MLRRAVISVVLGLGLGFGLPSHAQTACPHGALDKRYCDADNDMVADAPTNPKDFLDPDTLIFAYTPVEDPAVYAPAWRGFLDHLEKVTGKPVRLFQVQSNAAQFEALRSGRLHVTGANTGGVPVAVNCAGMVPFGMMASATEPHTYNMKIIVPAESAIQTPMDLKGKSIAFTAPTSNSGFKSPAYILQKEFGLKADVDYKSTFSGKHDTSILGVANNDYDAATVASTVLDRMLARKVFEADKIRVIYTSKAFPTTGYGLAHNLAPALAAKVREAFFTYDIDADVNMRAEFPGQIKFIPVNYKSDWEVVRDVDAATGVTYDCK